MERGRVIATVGSLLWGLTDVRSGAPGRAMQRLPRREGALDPNSSEAWAPAMLDGEVALARGDQADRDLPELREARSAAMRLSR